MDSLNCDISGFMQFEERPYEGKQFLCFSEVRNNEPLQLIGISYRLPSNSIVFRTITDLLIRDEFRGLGSKVKEL